MLTKSKVFIATTAVWMVTIPLCTLSSGYGWFPGAWRFIVPFIGLTLALVLCLMIRAYYKHSEDQGKSADISAPRG